MIPYDPKASGSTPNACTSYPFSFFHSYFFSPFISNFILIFIPLIFIILKIFPTWTLVIFAPIIYLCFVSCHLNNFPLIYEVLNLVANEVYVCHDIGLFRVAYTFHVSNLLMILDCLWLLASFMIF